MRKAILIILLTVVSSSALAEWVEVTNNGETFTAYADPATIRKAGNRVKMWYLYDYYAAHVVGGTWHMSAKARNEYDCKKEQLRMLYFSLHSGNMGEGQTVHIDSNPGKWEPVAPDSINEALWEVACNKR